MMNLGRGQLYVQAPPIADGVRHGGYEFALDAGKGLWLTPQSDSDAWGSTFALQMGQWKKVRYTRMVGGDDLAEKPETASPLWDKPETITGEITAYRGWDYDYQLSADGQLRVRLESRRRDFYWDGPVTTADETPTAANDHGLYAVAGTGHHKENFGQYVSDAPIWGRIALSGVVVEGTFGYRAERATIQELWVNPEYVDDGDSAEGLAKVLGDLYQCDVSVRAPLWDDLTKARG